MRQNFEMYVLKIYKYNELKRDQDKQSILGENYRAAVGFIKKRKTSRLSKALGYKFIFAERPLTKRLSAK